MLSATATNDHGSLSLARRRILLVEDETDVRETLAEILNDEGYIVTEAPEGLSALRRLESAEYDLILLDLMMPIMDGYQFLEKARAFNRDLPPVIVLTALNPRRIKGVFDQLRKPYRIRDLFVSIEKALAE